MKKEKYSKEDLEYIRQERERFRENLRKQCKSEKEFKELEPIVDEMKIAIPREGTVSIQFGK